MSKTYISFEDAMKRLEQMDPSEFRQDWKHVGFVSSIDNIFWTPFKGNHICSYCQTNASRVNHTKTLYSCKDCLLKHKDDSKK